MQNNSVFIGIVLTFMKNFKNIKLNRLKKSKNIIYFKISIAIMNLGYILLMKICKK